MELEYERQQKENIEQEKYLEELNNKFERLNNDLELQKKYKFKIVNNRIRKLLFTSTAANVRWVFLCDKLDCDTNAVSGKSYCKYHQGIINNPIPQELIDELNTLRDTDIYPEYSNIDFKINDDNKKKDIYRILKKSSTSKSYNSICLHKFCIKIPHFNYKNETEILYCSEHRLDNMIDIKAPQCINILDNGLECGKTVDRRIFKKYDGFCYNCYYKINEDLTPIKNIRVKETAVVNFIKSNYENKIKNKYKILDIKYDKYCDNLRPDISIICENNVIIIEVDENQHKDKSKSGQLYSKENEEKKMKLIREHYQKENKKTIFIRFNPDDYKTKDNKNLGVSTFSKGAIKSPWSLDEDKKLIVIDENDWNNRLKILKQKVDFYLKKKEIKNNSTIYLFYDQL